MKIGFLIINFYPVRGGAENNCYYLAKEMAKKHEVHVFCSSDKDGEDEVDGIKVHRCKVTSKLSYYLTFYPSLLDKLLKYDLDAIHLHGFGFVQNDRALKRYLETHPETRVVCTPHGPFMALRSYSFFKSCLKKLYLPVLRKNISKYDIVLKVNPFQDEWMISEYRINRAKIKFLPNGIPDDSFKVVSKEIKNKTENKYSLKNKFIITYLGRIQKYKGIEQIIRILPELSKIKENLLFVAMGKDDNGETNRLKIISNEIGADKSIVFTGEISEDEKNAILDLSRVFAFPSEWEAFGIGTLEAMARGNAVISSRTEGGKYLIEDGKNGYLFDYGNKEELLIKTSKLISDEKLLNKIRNNNIKKARMFLWKDIARKLEKIYRDLIVEKN